MKQRRYTVRYERDESGWWVGQVVEAPGAISQGRTIEQTRERVREALSALLDTDVSAGALDDEVHLPKRVQRMIDEAQQATRAAGAAQSKATEKARKAAQALTDLGLSLRDTGEVIGVSRQRVHAVLQKKAS